MVAVPLPGRHRGRFRWERHGSRGLNRNVWRVPGARRYCQQRGECGNQYRGGRERSERQWQTPGRLRAGCVVWSWLVGSFNAS